jgi:sigma-B regulation protein RsbU (phosphoserine phosphatase)
MRFMGDSIHAETISLSEEIANRLAVALENARLYTETQKLAQQERAVSEISTRITTSINIENILRTAVQELGRIMPTAEITVRLQEEKEE